MRLKMKFAFAEPIRTWMENNRGWQ